MNKTSMFLLFMYMYFNSIASKSTHDYLQAFLFVRGFPRPAPLRTQRAAVRFFLRALRFRRARDGPHPRLDALVLPVGWSPAALPCAGNILIYGTKVIFIFTSTYIRKEFIFVYYIIYAFLLILGHRTGSTRHCCTVHHYVETRPRFDYWNITHFI